MLENKVRDVFADMVVLKNPERTEFFSNLSLPSYMRDWLVMKFSDDDGVIDYDSVLRYIRQYIPSREDFEQFKFEMVNGETVRFLARIRVNVDVKTGKTLFELPDFGGSRAGASGEVTNDVVARWKETLLKESENWGIVELIWGKDFSSRQGKGVIKLIEYSPFCPYTVDLEFYKEARRAFTIDEWIDVLISAADYNPNGYDSEQQKLCFLRRLLPFVEKRLNLMELAPKGTGKSYVYQKISKRGWLISGGTVSRASLIYDNQKKTGGLLTRFDFVGFDEIQSMTFDKPSQIQTALKDYMEFGEVQGFDAQVVADAGVIVLGNINASRFNVNENMMEEVSSVFSESASLDRFHGFIPGWEIPRMHQGLVANGWALNTEYFAEVLHLLRDDLTYTTIVDECLAVPAKPDKRDLTAIKRLCTAFVKLLYPNATCKEDIPADEFIIDDEKANAIEFYLIQNGYVDMKRKVTDKYRQDVKNGTVAELPEELKPMTDGIHTLIQAVYDDSVLKDMFSDGHETKVKDNPLNENFAKKEFQALWREINHKYAYTVDFDSAELIRNAIAHIDEKLFVSELQYTTTIGRQKTEMNEYEIERGASFTGEKTRTQTLKHAETSQIKYDLIGKIAEGTVLTRRTVSAILQGIRVDKLYMFKNNPEEFITKVIRLINEQKATMIVEHISYDAIEGEYDSSIFTAEKATQSFDKAFLAKKAIQDYVFTDGSADKSIERKFAEDLDAADEVCVYAKLPRTFQIPTPVGNYSPDWAIAFYEGKVKHIFFIAETKGTMESLELRPIEQAKISCAKKLFNEMSTSNVVYHDVDSYQSLLNIMNSL